MVDLDDPCKAHESQDELSDSQAFIQQYLVPMCETSMMMQEWLPLMTTAMQDLWQKEVDKDVPIDAVSAATKDGSSAKGMQPAKKIGGKRYRLSRGVTVDSGAYDNVIPRRLLRGRRVRPSEASKAGIHYVACNNGRIPNEGEADLAFQSKEGHEHRWTFQVAEVNKVLAAVSDLVDTKHRVIFDQDERTGADISFIVDKTTGKATKMRRERKVWVVDAWIDEDDAGNSPASFARPE